MAEGFDHASSTIEPTLGDKANSIVAHANVRAQLELNPGLKDWGIDSVLIGSYARHVAIHRAKDVDVFCKLLDLEDDISPRTVIREVHNVLVDAFGAENVNLQTRSVKVALPEWSGLHVDVVPARQFGYIWQIPDRTDLDGWKETNPEKLTALSSKMNEALGLLYVPTVKLLRQTRRNLLGDSRPGGLYVEAALYNASEKGLISDTSQRHAYVSALDAVAESLARRDAIPNPAVPGSVYEFRAKEDEWSAAALAFADAARKGHVALSASRCDAARIFGELLGSNSDGAVVYPVPGDCAGGDRGHPIVVPGDARVTTGDQRFAGNGR